MDKRTKVGVVRHPNLLQDERLIARHAGRTYCKGLGPNYGIPILIFLRRCVCVLHEAFLDSLANGIRISTGSA